MTSPLLFAAGFMFMAILLLLGVIYSRIHWLIKALLVAISLVFCALFYQGHLDSLGYPAPIDAPPLFRFVYALVREPYPLKDDPGAIYVWMVVPDHETPRVMAIPYSEENRKVIAEAKKKAQGGEAVYMGIGAGKSKDGNGEKGNSSAGGVAGAAHKLASGGSTTVPYEVHGDALMFKAPPDTVPKKDEQHD